MHRRPCAETRASCRSWKSVDPDAILELLPLSTPDYIRLLGALLKKFNHAHSVKDKGVSPKTMIDRERFLVSQVATHDHSWTARDVDIAAKIAEVSAIDPWVGLRLELCAEFGLRGKEARHFRPHEAVIPLAAANLRDAEAFPECETFVRISRGTKGGRLRDVPLSTESQRALLPST